MPRIVTESDLFEVEAPQFTKTWHPFAHSDVIIALDNACHDFNVKVLNRHYSANESLTRMFGLWDLDYESNGRIYQLGFRSAIDKAFAIGITCGFKITVCSNMMISGDFLTFRKHTGGLEKAHLDELGSNAVTVMLDRMTMEGDWHDRLRRYQIDNHAFKTITYDLIKEGAIPPSKFDTYLKAYIAEKDLSETKWGTLYEVHGAVTRTIKDTSLFNIADRSINLKKVCDQTIARYELR